ncbi:MAG: DUF296 domain-containing protein [Candidatus Woesearchaeota archaeon]
MKTYAVRLEPGQDLRKAIAQYFVTERIHSGAVLSCVGSLEKAILRLSDESILTLNGKFEIISLTGTLSKTGHHLHLGISDREGVVYGGHLKEGCIVYTTAEIVIGALDVLAFSRTFDPKTGYKELKISKK